MTNVAPWDRRAVWFTTYSGARFHPFAPLPVEVGIEDIAHALEMVNNANAEATSRARHFAQAMRALGAISDVDLEGWFARFARCPGHDHDPCRVWCAYCGDIEPQIGEWAEDAS